ncbi:acyltransferase family protein [Vibrio aquimaris]|nr:acyltransferase family protein [Vibrio aquimaris]
MTTLHYRPEIDGLRAIAVLSVVLYHVGFEFIPGGFIGVDIFFVISGYLISKLVFKQVSTGDFSFGTFYLRRVRRLVPALLLVLVSCFFIEFLFYPASEFQKFTGSLVYSIIGMSNIYFWSEVGYFDTASSLKPLLHTWSLSVEEQFYLFFPIIIFLASKVKIKQFFPIILISMGVGSYILNVIVFSNNGLGGIFESKLFTEQSSAFYLMPFRVFEFLIGTSLIWVESYRIKKDSYANLIFFAGCFLILYSLFYLSEEDIFPYYNALPSCIGSALIIYSSSYGFAKKVLSIRGLVFIGLISYSLYLIHWPLIIYWNEFSSIDNPTLEKFLMIAISLILAILSFYFIEKPFRRPSKSDSGFLIASFSTSLVLMAISANVWKYDGWSWREEGPTSKLEASEIQENEIYLEEINLNYPIHEDLHSAHTCTFDTNQDTGEIASPEEVANCAKVKIRNNGFILVGDSTGRDALIALKLAYPRENFAMIHQSGCAPSEDAESGCFLGLSKIFSEYLTNDNANIKGVIFASRYLRENYKSFINDVEGGEYDKYSVFIIGPYIGKKGSIGKIVEKQGYSLSGEYSYYKKMEAIVSDIESELEYLQEIRGNVRFFSKKDAFCSSTKCKLHTTNNQVLLVDDIHLSRIGMQHMSKELLRNNFLD